MSPLTVDELIKGSVENTEAEKETRAVMLERLSGKSDLVEKLLPDWSLGCKCPLELQVTHENGVLTI